MTDLPADLDAEHAVLGAAMLSPRVIDVISGDEGLRGEHFYDRANAMAYEAMLRLRDRGLGVDRITVADELRRRGQLEAVGGPHKLDELDAPVYNASNVRGYARAIVQASLWRTRLRAALDIHGSVENRDEERYLRAEAMLGGELEQGRKRTFAPAELADLLYEQMATGEVEAFDWPFRRLNTLTQGGARRGQVTLISGPTSHGKSIVVDQCVESMLGKGGRRGRLYINEMTPQERTMRIVSRRAVVRFESIASGDLNEVERRRVLQALNDMATEQFYSVVDCSGWTPRDICRDIRRGGFDVVAVDLLNRLPHKHPSRVKDLEEASVEFSSAAKDAGCHVILVCHINRQRVDPDGRVPFPTLNDIRDTAALANDADNVLFVWREQDDLGDPGEDGLVRFGKVRNGKRGGVEVCFEPEFMRFVPKPEPLAAVA